MISISTNKTNKDLSKTIAVVMDRVPRVIPDVAEALSMQLYAVGGCVRDPLLNRPMGDIDIAVVGDAPKLAKVVSERLNAGQVAIYSRFKTALLRTPQGSIEFATARKESYKPDSRKPAVVIPSTIEEDLQRRDFTINALALGLTGQHKGKILDLFDGLGDIKRKILRTPLEPDVTYIDDPLRMLRAVRFAAEFDFQIDPASLESIQRNAGRLFIVASERIGDEFLKMLAGANPVRAMNLLIETKLMERIIPEVIAMSGVEQVGRHHHKDVLTHSLRVMQNVVEKSDDPILRLAALLHDVGKPLTKRFDKEVGWTFHGHEALGAKMVWRIGRRLRIGRDNLAKLTQLVRLHMRPVNLTDEGVTDSAIRRLMMEASEYLDDQLILCRADITTANPNLVTRYLENFAEMSGRMADVAARDKIRQFQSPVRGKEIMQICNLPPGPFIGALKGRIEDAILDGIIPNDYSAAKDYLMKIRDDVLSSDPDKLHAENRNRSRNRKSIKSDFNFPDERD